MCGIIGYLGKKEGTSIVLTGLSLLQNRGYDSVGISSVTKNNLHTTKYACPNAMERLKKVKCSNTIIAHTRWATHGVNTCDNAHPHHDESDRISVVHNGIIENYDILKNKLLEKGYSFRSQTDSEVIAILVGSYLDEGCTMEESISHTISKLEGTWALLFLNKNEPDKMWLTRNGSPLLLAIDEICMVVSEPIAFDTSIKEYKTVENYDILTIKRTNDTYEVTPNIQYKTHVRMDTSIHSLTYPHWMIQEIIEQPQSIQRAIEGRIDDIVHFKELETLKGIENLIFVGCGTSYHAALWARSLFTSLETMNTVSVYDAAEFSMYDIPNGKTAMILLSQSGETKDVYRCLQMVKNKLITISIVNVVDSIIARETDHVIYIHAGREIAVASTKSFTNQCVVLSLVAIWFSQQKNTCVEKRNNMIHDLNYLSKDVKKVLENRNSIKEIALTICNTKSLFLLGKGQNEAIAKEGSLKLKEIVYVHAEGYSSSALKHGPLALVDDTVPVLMIDDTMNTYHEVKARNSNAILLKDLRPKNDTYDGLLANIVIQILSYEWCLLKGLSPDFPRNLAKVVTVE